MDTTPHRSVTNHPSAYRPPTRNQPAGDEPDDPIIELADGVELSADDLRALARLDAAGLLSPATRRDVA